MARRAMLLVIVVLVSCNSRSSAQQSVGAPPRPPVRPAAGTAHADWLRQWQAALPATATLHRGEHRGEVAGSFFSRVKIVYPVFNAPIRIDNRTGHRLATGAELYVVQTASAATEKDNAQVFEVIGGTFKQSPSEDYVGSVEVRGGKVTPETGFGLFDSLDSTGRHGFFGSALDVLMSIAGDGNILEQRFAKTASFGAAEPGKPLSIESDDLQVTVRVRSEFEGSTYLVSPPLQFGGKSDTVAFRYIFRFERGASAPSESVLIAIDDGSLLPLMADRSQPMWKRVFATGWAGQLTSPESVAALGQHAADAGEPVPVRLAALLSLGRRKASFDVIRAVAENKKEPPRLRAAAAWALRTGSDPSAGAVLTALLSESDSTIKARAVDALAELKATHVVDSLLALLTKRESQEIRANIMSALERLGDQTTADKLAAAANTNPDLRRLVIPALAKLGGAKAVPALAELYAVSASKGTKDENWPARADVCEALTGIKDPAALALLQKAADDPHDSVRFAAIRALSSVQAAEGDRAVLPLIDDPKKDVARAAIRALGTNRSPAAKAKLLEVLKAADRPKEVRWAAIEALGEYGDADVAKALLATLAQEKDSNLRAETLNALSQQAGAEARAAIRQALQDQDEFVVGRAARIWRRLNGIGACSVTLDALVARKDGPSAEKLVNTLTLPGCRDRASFEKIAGHLGTGDAAYDGELTRLLKSWSGQDLAADKAKWLAWAKEHASF